MNLVSRENTQVGSFEYSDPSERTERYRREAEALTELAGNPEFYHEPLADAFRRITESAARALNVSRVSIWRWNRDRTAIRCADLFESATGMHSSGMELSASSFPSYFHACRLSKVIAADDAGTDPRTSEFLDSYLRPLGISSMLDAPVHFQGRIDGVLCNEHVGAPRRWTEDEKAFTVAQANLVALTLERNERRQAEAAARRNLERFEMVARATIDLVYDWDIGDNVIWWSSKMNTLLGYGPEHTQNTLQFWVDRIHPHDRDAVEANLTDSLASSAEIFTAEYRFRKMDGTYACIQDRGFIQRDLQNRAIRMTGAMTDISARKAAEEELRLSERRFRSLIENLSDLITVVNREGLITYEGPSSIRVLGIDPEQMSGHAFLSFIHPEDRESAVKAIDLAFSESTGFSNTRFRWRGRNLRCSKLA